MGADGDEVPAAAVLLTPKGLPTDPEVRKNLEKASEQAALERKKGAENAALAKEVEAEKRRERLAAEKEARRAAKAAAKAKA